MSSRFIYNSLITRFNKPFKFPLHLNVCSFGSSESDINWDRACSHTVNLPVRPGIPFTGRTKINSFLVCTRSKHSKSKKTSQADDDEEVDNEYYTTANDEENNLGKTISVNVASLRIDIVLKAGLGLSRTKVEEYFYQSRVRVNDEKVMKKSAQATLGDDIDIVRGISSKSDRYIDVMRLHIVGIRVPKDPQAKLELKVKRDKLLTIENYKNAWSGDNIS